MAKGEHHGGKAAQTGTASWLELFHQVFKEIEEPLGFVLNATACREHWLQGEFYRRLKPLDETFCVNEFSLKGQHKADLYGTKAGEMVAEIKIYGTQGYYPKNLTGEHKIDHWLPKEAGGLVTVTYDQAEKVNPYPGSFMSDYLGLAEAAGEMERYLILVIHQNGGPDDFGKAISAIQFPYFDPERTYDKFRVHMWRVPKRG